MFVVCRNLHDPAKAKGRAVVDSRCLNKLWPINSWPLPDLLLCLDQLQAARYFGTLDLKSGFWQVAVAEKDRPKLAFVMPLGLHEYMRVPMGHRNAPPVFMRAIDSLIDRGNLPQSTIAFVDDLMCHSKEWMTYLTAQLELFSVLDAGNWKATCAKLYLGYTKIKVLGYVISASRAYPV